MVQVQEDATGIGEQLRSGATHGATEQRPQRKRYLGASAWSSIEVRPPATCTHIAHQRRACGRLL
eukprot:1301624-Pleurochrysis_carterae.AAC.2